MSDNLGVKIMTTKRYCYLTDDSNVAKKYKAQEKW